MSIYRDEAVAYVGRMRELWPVERTEDGKTSDKKTLEAFENLETNIKAEVSMIRDKLVSMIHEINGHNRTVRKIYARTGGNTFGGRSRDSLNYDDAIQQFWVGVTKGLLLVEARISPDGEEDVNDPLEFLINKGKWKVLDMKRAANLRRLVQKCPKCGAITRLFRPNIGALAFDETMAKKLRGDIGEDMVAVDQYRKRLLQEKIRRALVKNPCKDCYEQGVQDWYPLLGPADVGHQDFEFDLQNIDFMIFDVDTDVVEIYMSSDSFSDEEPINFIENVSTDAFTEEAYNPYDEIDNTLDSRVVQQYIIHSDDDPIYALIYYTLYSDSEDICSVCPRRAKYNVGAGISTIDDVRREASMRICGVSDAENLGDWDTEYSQLASCGGIPRTDCDNLNQRIANYLGMYAPQIRTVRKTIENRYGAYITIEEIIIEAIREINEEKEK